LTVVVDVSGELPVILLELDPDNDMEVKKTYIYANSEILAQHDGDHTDTRYFYMHDRLGSVREVINTSAQVVRHYTFGPFGQTIESSNESQAPSNALMFTGQCYDPEIGQYYVRARQYDPLLMRLTAEDLFTGELQYPITLHKYLYCGNDPINRIDPSGKCSAGELFEPVEAAAAVSNFVLNILADAVAKGRFDEEYVMKMLNLAAEGRQVCKYTSRGNFRIFDFVNGLRFIEVKNVKAPADIITAAASCLGIALPSGHGTPAVPVTLGLLSSRAMSFRAIWTN
jgi:RHS repeat-associated protein